MEKPYDRDAAKQQIAKKLQAQETTKLRKPPRRVMVGLTEDQFNHLHSVAFRAGTSVSNIGQDAIVRFLIAAEKGEVLLLPEFFERKPGRA